MNGPAEDHGYVTGDKDCYQQIFGEYSGCYKQDMRYQGEQLAADLSVLNWGECALLCKVKRGCKFWSWDSTSCTNCIRERCTTFAENAVEKPDQIGVISGDVGCQDIPFAATDEEKIRDTLGLEVEAQSGGCKVAYPDFWRSICPAQEVPGYR